MNANEQNLVTADEYFDVEIDGTWSSADTSAVTIHNYTTDATRYINIYTTTTARHKGVWSTSYYMLNAVVGGHYGSLLSIQSQYVSLSGLQLTFVSSGGDANQQHCINGYSYSKIYNNICKPVWNSPTNGYDLHGIITAGAQNGTWIKIWNNIVYNCKDSSGNGIGIGHWSQPNSSDEYIYNNTVYNCGKGIRSSYQSKSTVLYNNICNNNGTDYEIPNDTNADNISEDTTSPNDEWDSTAVAFVSETAGSEDFHLDAGSSAIDGGTTDPGSGLFSDDIDGVTRTGTWDIGADEYVAGGGGAAPLTGYMSCQKGIW